MTLHRQLERISLILAASLWGYAALAIGSLPETVPTHFNFAGEADSFGSKHILWMLPVIATILVGLMSVVKMHPDYLNMPFRITGENRERQTNLAYGLLSSIACVIPLLFAFIIYSTAQHVEYGTFDFPIVLVLAAVFVPIGVYFYLAYRAR
jgi:uncharacterized membrane protein